MQSSSRRFSRPILPDADGGVTRWRCRTRRNCVHPCGLRAFPVVLSLFYHGASTRHTHSSPRLKPGASWEIF